MSIISYTPPWSLFRPHSKGYENTLGNFRNKLYLKVDCVNWNYFSINAEQSGATIRVPKVTESVITVVIFHTLATWSDAISRIENHIVGQVLDGDESG